jgi:GTP-binding protein
LKLTAAEFVTSAADLSGLPTGDTPEVAMVGRSNVGKSSLINALTRLRLARTSGTPGKTRLVNLYRIQPAGHSPFLLVDLPGYGYARGVAPNEFEPLLQAYFGGGTTRRRRPAIAGSVLLVDARHPGLANDLETSAWLRAQPAPSVVVATKVDKLSRTERTRAVRTIAELFQADPLPCSAVTGEGLDTLWKVIIGWTNPPR